MRISLLLALLYLTGTMTLSAQPNKSEKVPLIRQTTVRDLSKREQVDAAIELLVRLKNAVGDSNKDRADEAYKRIAIQSVKCTLLYGLLSKNPPTDNAAAVKFANASAILNLISGFLYTQSLSNFKVDADLAQQHLLNIRKNNEEQKMFYLLRNCSELIESRSKALETAISELMVN